VNVSATDAESIPVLTTSTLPSGATFVDSGNGTGTFDWTPNYTQAGTYSVTFYATDDSLAVDSEVVTITVTDAGNQPPVLAPIGTQSTTEGVLLTFAVSATDPDSTIPTLSTSTLPAGAAFVDNGDGTGGFAWTPDYLQSGGYSVTFYASDGVAVDSEVVTITVIEAGNQLPVLSPIGAQSTTEGILLTIAVSATDVESVPVLTTSTLPTGATFVDNGDGSGNFDWTPDYTQAGTYNVTFYATDDSSAVDSELVVITVADAGNQAPSFLTVLPDTIEVYVNVQTQTVVEAADPDLDPLILTAVPILAGATFDTAGGVGTYTYTPGPADVDSVYRVMFIATDPSGAADTIITHYHVNAYLRGDTDGDTKYTMNDVVFLINYLIRSGPAPNPLAVGDVDGDGVISVSDVVYLVNFMYQAGPPPQ